MNGPAAMKLLLEDGTEISGRAFGTAHQPSAVPRPNRLTSEKCHKRTHALHTRKHDDRKKRATPQGNTSGASNTASATTQASGGGINGRYSTTFPLTENPISEGGSWTNGGATGLGWANVQTTPRLSFGTSPVNAGTYLYADPTAVLKNAWPQDQQVQATVKVRGAFGRACCKEPSRATN